MIRIQRGKAPLALAPLRRSELLKLRAALRSNPGALDALPNSYAIAKRPLWLAQHKKCCYCEIIEQLGHNDVEHFRPKARAHRQPGSSRTHGYWWLTWTWTNLLFACASCNRDHKGERFPLELGCRVLRQGQPPPGGERPLLLDPAREEPMRHIQFRPILRRKDELWLPFPRAGSQRGAETIRVLGLDRPALLDLYKDHVEEVVRPRVQRLGELMHPGGGQQVRWAWRDLTRELVDPRRPLTALSRDALEHLVPEDARKRWKLELPLPLALRR